MALTRKQRALVNEIESLVRLFGLNYQDIVHQEPEMRTSVLEVLKRDLVRGDVVLRYILVDELLGMRICSYFFPTRRCGYASLWRTKKFQRFNHYILEDMSLMEKLRLVNAIRPLPRAIRADVERLNALRNGLAHAFFPENLRKSKPEWKGLDVFSLAGAERLDADCQRIYDHFVPSGSSRGEESEGPQPHGAPRGGASA